MSEIKCGKLEITSLRQCDSIKIWGNIGPCIIEGQARHYSCQACQTCCNYWIWPVTHTQINPVKITGYIDFLFLFVRPRECVPLRLCQMWIFCDCGFHACVQYISSFAHIHLWTLHVMYVTGLKHAYKLKVKGIPVERAGGTSGAQSLFSFGCWVETSRRPDNHFLMPIHYNHFYFNSFSTSSFNWIYL